MDELADELRSQILSPEERTRLWRKHVLIEAGYSRQQAERMSSESSIDLHAAVDLVIGGCPPGLAERILKPLED